MQPREQALRVRVYLDEDDTWHGQPLQAALLDHLLGQGFTGYAGNGLLAGGINIEDKHRVSIGKGGGGGAFANGPPA